MRFGLTGWFPVITAAASTAVAAPCWSASAEDRLYFLDDDGTMHAVRAEPRFEVPARNPLGEPCRASPAVSRGRIFIRVRENVYCIGSGFEDGERPAPRPAEETTHE